MTSARPWLVASLIVGLALRLGFGLAYWVDQPLTHDEREYLALGRSLARGEGFSYPADDPAPGTGQRFGRAPGYPVFLAALRVIDPVDHVPRRLKIAQACVGTLGIWLIAVLAGRAAGSRAAVAAGGIAAIYPPLIFIPAYALSETLSSTATLAAVLMLDTAVRRERAAPKARAGRSAVASAMVAGALSAAATLIRPAMLFFLPLAAIWLWRIRRSMAIAFLLLVVAGIAPWTIRNREVYGRFVAIASEGGVTFWTGNHALAIGDGDLAANPELKQADLEFRRAHPTLSADQLEPLYYREALAWMRGHPIAFLRLELRKLFYTIVPVGPSYRLHSAAYFAASAIPYALLLYPAVVGGWRLWRRGRAPIALWLAALATVIAGLVFFPQERFRIPVIDPALIVTAAALAAFGEHERTHRRSDV